MKSILLFLIRSYQVFSRAIREQQPPFFIATQCKFEPSCSEYAVLSIEQRGPLYGSIKAIGRICRCHPWSVGGVDYPS